MPTCGAGRRMVSLVSELVIIAHNIRSTHNIGAILRTADGFGVSRVYCTGYTPYPELPGDTRLAHLRQKITKQIHKTALGAEVTIPVEHAEEVLPAISSLLQQGFQIVALEQHKRAVLLPNFTPPQKTALLLGEEVHGTPQDLLAQCNAVIEIPMRGKKESYNVSVAAGIAMYALTVSQAPSPNYG